MKPETAAPDLATLQRFHDAVLDAVRAFLPAFRAKDLPGVPLHVAFSRLVDGCERLLVDTGQAFEELNGKTDFDAREGP